MNLAVGHLVIDIEEHGVKNLLARRVVVVAATHNASPPAAEKPRSRA